MGNLFSDNTYRSPIGLTVDGDAAFNGDVTFGNEVGDATTYNAELTVGVDGTGYDVNFFMATAGKKFFVDESADTVYLTCTTDIDGTVTVGVDDTGYDVKFFGATASAYMLWDESADDLILAGDAGLSVAGATALAGITTVTAASGIISTVSGGLGTFLQSGNGNVAAVAAGAAIPLTNYYSKLDSTAGATTQTLAASTVKGLLKKIHMTVDNGDDVVTVTSLTGGTTITFADAGDYAILQWTGTAWMPLELGNSADGVTAPVLGG